MDIALISHNKARAESAQSKNHKTRVFTQVLDGVEYYGRIEEIYELMLHGCKPLNPIIFKCHWFDPQVVRLSPNLGLVEI